jgi:hypothetical protein
MASRDPVLCFTCKKDFSKGRNPQIVVCCSCKELVHRVCLPENLSPQEYVRLKKNNKVLDFECILCYAKKHGVKSSVSRKRKAPAKKPEPRTNKATTRPQQGVPGVCREILSLHLMPAEKIPKRFDSIMDRVNQMEKSELLLQFCRYAERVSITRSIWTPPPTQWS